MGRVLTNSESLSFAREASLGVLPGTPQWFELEPNGINAFGNTISTTKRSPISRARARRKGTVTDLDSAVEVDVDLTLTHLRLVTEDFCFSRAVGGDVYLASAATATGYTVPALSVAQAGRLLYNAAGPTTLVHAHGFNLAANNGAKLLSAAPAAADTEIKVAGNAVEAPAATDLVELAIAGVRGAVGDLSIDAGGNLISAGALDFTLLGLTAGQVIHIGGVDVLHQFASVADIGFARVAAGGIAAHKLTLEKRDQAFVADAGAGVAVDILFGQFVRNVPVDHADFMMPSEQFELASLNLMDAGATGYEYALGNVANSLSMAIPLSGKATMTIGYVGTHTTDPSATRALDAENAKVGGLTAAFGTASDIARLRAQDVDEEGLTTDFKTATFTLTNNVAGEKVLGVLGPKYLNAGDIEVDVETTMLFTNPAIPERIRCNKTVGLDWVLRNGDGGVAFDLPTVTLTGGKREYPANQSVTMTAAFAAHQEAGLDFTLGVSFFPILPTPGC